ncbi:hypothetical protein SNB73_01715, partial [Escherichia coli]|nr:hypothetical protein [Escherichia coli]
GTADRNRSHWSTSKTPSYTKSVSWQHHREMSLPLLPYVQTSSGKQLLDGQVYEDLSHEQQYEALALNRVNVPFTWKRSFSEVVDEDGLLWLEGKQNQDGWIWQGNNIVITYTRDEGMTRVIPANPK